ncbi:hypothetical protein ACIGO8_31545 [Streptomyces sp. NPDC053493]|uniref:hypothetical protein n=1 Tax=Streptomyces sp. NPDC053493 TaxID=3365705 RepID=UPI0037CEAAFB
MSSTETENRPRPRRRGPLLVASVAAGVLLAGGGGVYYAATASGEGGAAAPDASSVRDASQKSGGGPAIAPGEPDPGGGPGIAPGEPDPGGGGDGTVYKAKGPLPQGPSSAAVHRPEGRVTSAEVTRLAQALGLTGTPRLVGDVWRLTPEKDTDGLRLDVSAKAPGNWTLSRHDGGPVGDSCLKGRACPPPGEAKPPTAGGSPVSEAAAKAAVAPVLKAIGQDDAKLDASQLMNGSTRVVNADPVVDGLPTYGWSTGLHVGPDGSLVAGSGRLKEPAKDGAEPVIGAEKALADLNETARRTGTIGGCATDPPAGTADRPAGKPTSGPADRHTAPCRAGGTDDGAGTQASPHVVTVTGAVFGLAAQYVDGEQVLVPAWLFQAQEKPGARPYTVVRSALASDRPSPAPSPGEAGPARQISGYAADASGRKLSVTFWGGVCSTYTVTAQESARQVVVRIAEKPTDPGKACIAIAVEVTKTVTLQQPLDGRQVVDAASGQAVPARGK